MAYDYQKVQTWLHNVTPELSLPIFLALHGEMPALPEVVPFVLEAQQFSTWERVNACYGLRDLIDQQVLATTKRWARKARLEDEDHDLELQKMIELGLVCGICRQRFVHHQHPLKPMGVIMCSTCGCQPVVLEEVVHVSSG